MPMDDNGVTYDEFIKDTFPDLFAANKAHHDCAYRDLLFHFVQQDLRENMTSRLEGWDS